MQNPRYSQTYTTKDPIVGSTFSETPDRDTILQNPTHTFTRVKSDVWSTRAFPFRLPVKKGGRGVGDCSVLKRSVGLRLYTPGTVRSVFGRSLRTRGLSVRELRFVVTNRSTPVSRLPESLLDELPPSPQERTHPGTPGCLVLWVVGVPS